MLDATRLRVFALATLAMAACSSRPPAAVDATEAAQSLDTERDAPRRWHFHGAPIRVALSRFASCVEASYYIVSEGDAEVTDDISASSCDEGVRKLVAAVNWHLVPARLPNARSQVFLISRAARSSPGQSYQPIARAGSWKQHEWAPGRRRAVDVGDEATEGWLGKNLDNCLCVRNCATIHLDCSLVFVACQNATRAAIDQCVNECGQSVTRILTLAPD